MDQKHFHSSLLNSRIYLRQFRQFWGHLAIDSSKALILDPSTSVEEGISQIKANLEEVRISWFSQAEDIRLLPEKAKEIRDSVLEGMNHFVTILNEELKKVGLSIDWKL